MDKHTHTSRSMWLIASFDRSTYPHLAKRSPYLYNDINKALAECQTSLSIIADKERAIYAPNILTNAGMHVMAGRSTGDDNTTNTHMSIGTGVTAESIADTQLEAEIARKLISTRSTIAQTERYATSYVYEDLPAGSPVTVQVTEAGIQNEAVGGSLISRITGNPQELSDGSIIAITVTTTHENYGEA